MTESGQARAREGDARWEAYLEAIRGGATERAACALAGLPRSTLSEWVKDPETQAEEDLARETYLEEVRGRVEAIARGVDSESKAAAAAAAVELRANTWLLEKRDPDRFGARIATKNEHSGPGGGPIATVQMPPANDAAALAELEQIQARIAETIAKRKAAP